MLFSIIQVASAYYNDKGNDSCLTIYSDKKDYTCLEGRCQTILAFHNNCGYDITDAQVGIFLKLKYLNKIQFKKIYLWQNGQWNDITQQMIENMDINNMYIRKGWVLKFGWKDVNLPEDNRIIKIVFDVLEPINTAFKVGARRAGDHSVRSILDPTFRSAFFPFNIPSNYTTYNTTIIDGYCALEAGKLQGYCDTNYLAPVPTVLNWWNVDIIDNYDDTQITLSHADDSQEDQRQLHEFALKVDYNNLGGFSETYDVNAYMYKDGANENLYVYFCGEDYTSGNLTTDGNCSIIKTYIPADIGNSYAWYSFSVDNNVFMDNNKFYIVYYCPNCLTQKKYWMGIDTDNDENSSHYSNDDGESYLSQTGEYMVKINQNASGTMYQYTINGTDFYYINDGNLESISTATGQIKIRSWLTRYNTSYDVNVDSLDINYSDNTPPDVPDLIPEPDTNQTSTVVDWNASADDEGDSPIMYNIIVGTTYRSDNILDANAFDLNYTISDLWNGTVYWSVRGCDDANGDLAGYYNCGDWGDDNFYADLPNEVPSVPILVDEPNGQYEGQVFLQWLESTDYEENPITYNLKLGTTSGGIEILDVNTIDLNYTTPSLNADVYYWSVKACDDYGCSEFSAEDNFRIITEGEFMITAIIDNSRPYVEFESIDPIYWDGVSEVNVRFNCKDPNGIEDLNSAHIDVSGTALIQDIPVVFITETGFAYNEISSYFTQEGDYIIDPVCVDNEGQESITGTLYFYYTPSYSISINNNAETTNSLTVDLNLYAPNPLYFALSCDGDNWSDWIAYTTYYSNFNMGSGENGCEPHGEGLYYVYVAFADLNNVYTTYDTIIAEGVDKEYEGYINPEETSETTTAYFALMGGEAWGLGVIVLLAIIVISFYVISRRRRRY